MTTFTWLGRWLPSLLLLTLFASHANAQSTRQLLPSMLQAILAEPLPTPPAGAARGDITVVEYFDYACPVCRHL